MLKKKSKLISCLAMIPFSDSCLAIMLSVSIIGLSLSSNVGTTPDISFVTIVPVAASTPFRYAFLSAIPMYTRSLVTPRNQSFRYFLSLSDISSFLVVNGVGDWSVVLTGTTVT